jgi:hypothetical protein
MLQSDSIDELAAALADAQAELAPVARDSSASTGAYTYAYASLAVVLEAVRPVLNRHSLAVTQTVVARVEPILAEHVEHKRGRDGSTIEQRIPVQSLGSVRTTLAHSSGQWIASEVPILAPWGDVQQVGAAVTYFRRIALKAIVGLAEVDETDDRPSAAPERDESPPRSAAAPRATTARATSSRAARNDPRSVAEETKRANTGVPTPACPPNLRGYWKARGLESELVKVVKEIGLSGPASQWSEADRLAVHEAMRRSFPEVAPASSEDDIHF